MPRAYPTRPGGGRPKTPIDWSEVDRMLTAGCMGSEIAAYLGIHNETLYRRCEKDLSIGFSEYLHQKRAKGDGIIRMAQFDEAVRKRDRAMLIWLGKQRLGQSEQQKVDMSAVSELQVVNFSDHNIQQWGNHDETSDPESDSGITERAR